MPTDPFDPAYRLRRHRRGGPGGAGRRTRRSCSRSPGRRAGRTAAAREPDAAEPARPHELLARDRGTVLGPASRLPVRALLVGLERAEPPGFLAPQFDSRGRSVAPANYAKLYAAAYAGIKAGNPTAQVAIGETSARGSDRPAGAPPDTFAGQVRRARREGEPAPQVLGVGTPPVSVHPDLRPGQIVKWPNVSLASLPRFQQNLKKWFRRKNPQIWVTEYGHQTRPAGRPWRQLRDAVRVRPAVDRPRQADTRSSNVHLVRLPGRPGPGMGVGHLHAERQREGQFAEIGSRRARRPLDARNAIYSFRAGDDDSARQALHATLLRRPTRPGPGSA